MSQSVSQSVSQSFSRQSVSQSVYLCLSVCLYLCQSVSVSFSVYHSFTRSLTNSMYAFTDIYREFGSIHLRDTLVEVSDHHWFLTLQTKVLDFYSRLYEDKSLRLQRVKKVYTQKARLFGEVGLQRGLR